MNIVARIKLHTTKEHGDQLRQLMAQYNAACNFVSAFAVKTNTYGKYDLHHACYRDVRSKFGLKANHAVRAISRVSASYKVLTQSEKKAYAKFKSGDTDKWRRDLRGFKWRNGIELDARLWGILKNGKLSLTTMSKTIRLDWYINDHNQFLVEHRTDSATLVYRHGKFFLHVVCDVPVKEQIEVVDFVGVDMGVNEIAVTSDGDSWNSEQIEKKRQWYALRKSRLQQVGTPSAKRRLVELSGREQRFKRDVDHCISKHIVTNAERTRRGIAVEELAGIRERVTLRKGQRAKHHRWSFYRLRSYIEYKSVLAGVPVVAVNAAYTSRTCNKCGCCDKRNRKSQAVFLCVQCGYSVNADFNAALNIKDRAIQQAYGETDSVVFTSSSALAGSS